MFFNDRKMCDVFAFRSDAGWKENCGLKGWFKKIPINELLKGYKYASGHAPKGGTAKVFIEYLEHVA